ncbi:MAG: ATP-binding cassette domain-containing protein [Verrucomicrobiae bacterium]|nr:ATP-binding cassette domain-containing protein [Verrucomicrobiae bacterium]MCP5520697.1 ATP-binding cassette domain-containing protein [Verrucomicrobiales bacterium]
MDAATATSNTGIGLSVSGLRKSYQGTEVLCGLDLEVQPGELFVIMGPSGSGKTVLLKHLIGLETADAGEILLAGEPVQAPGVLDRLRVAMVFQSGALLSSLTVAENVGLYLSEHRLKPPAEIQRIVAEKLALVGLEGTEAKMPAELSGGMRKRAALARALVIDPQLIFYDEPTSELDPMIAVTIGGEILRLNRRMGVTSVVVTHDRELGFGIAHRMALIAGGTILAMGTPEEIRQSDDPTVRRFLSASYDFDDTKGPTHEKHA